MCLGFEDVVMSFGVILFFIFLLLACTVKFVSCITFCRVFSETKSFPASNVRPSNSSSNLIDDPLLVFESSVSQSDFSWPLDGPSNQENGKASVQSSIDDFDVFISGGTKSKVDGTANKLNSSTSLNEFGNGNYVDDIFGGNDHVQKNNAGRPSSMSQVNSSFFLCRRILDAV